MSTPDAFSQFVSAAASMTEFCDAFEGANMLCAPTLSASAPAFVPAATPAFVPVPEPAAVLEPVLTPIPVPDPVPAQVPTQVPEPVPMLMSASVPAPVREPMPEYSMFSGRLFDWPHSDSDPIPSGLEVIDQYLNTEAKIEAEAAAYVAQPAPVRPPAPTPVVIQSKRSAAGSGTGSRTTPAPTDPMKTAPVKPAPKPAAKQTAKPVAKQAVKPVAPPAQKQTSKPAAAIPAKPPVEPAPKQPTAPTATPAAAQISEGFVSKVDNTMTHKMKKRQSKAALAALMQSASTNKTDEILAASFAVIAANTRIPKNPPNVRSNAGPLPPPVDMAAAGVRNVSSYAPAISVPCSAAEVIMTGDNIMPGAIDLRGRYGISIITDRLTGGILLSSQDGGMNEHIARLSHTSSRDEPFAHKQAYVVKRYDAVSPTTGEECTPYIMKSKQIVPGALKSAVAARKGTLIEHDDDLFNDKFVKSALVACARGHKWRARPHIIINNWCMICEYEEVYRNYAVLTEQKHAPPFCTVASYEVAGKTRLNLPFQCHAGHRFMVGTAEVALGECPVCNIEREYLLAGQNGVRVIGGTFWNPNCMLRACCTICFNEFYISPQEMSGGCATRHKSVNPRIANMANAIRVLETIFNTRFDDMPDDPVLRCDAYSAKYRFGIVAYDNPYSHKNYEHKTSLNTCVLSDKYGSILYRVNMMPTSSLRDIAVEIVSTVMTNVGGFSRCQSDTKLQFIGELLKIMDALANANRDYPARGLVRNLAA